MTYQIDKKRSIGQAAKEIGVQEHVIRFWETQFDEIQPTIGSGNRRYFYDDDIKILRTIKYYLYEKGFTIKGLQKILKDKEISVNDGKFYSSTIDNDYTNAGNTKNIVKSSINDGADIENKNNNRFKNNFSGASDKKNNSKLKNNLKSFKVKLNIFYEKLKSI